MPEMTYTPSFLMRASFFRNFVNTLTWYPLDTKFQTVDKVQSTVNFLKNPKKPKGKDSPHVEYNYINTTRKKTRR